MLSPTPNEVKTFACGYMACHVLTGYFHSTQTSKKATREFVSGY